MTNGEDLIHSFNGHNFGLTKREYFAGLALQGVLANRELQLAIIADGESFEGFSVDLSDDLLEALNV